MHQAPADLPAVILRRYLHAKDENRPHLLDSTFAADAELEIRNATTSIAFPAVTHGRSAIADVLVRHFGQTYENVYTFCLQQPAGASREFECPWLVAMTEKAGGAVRIGGGRYHWTFGAAPPQLATKLVITISIMQVLPAETMPLVYDWVAGLSYPWASPADVVATAPRLSALQPVVDLLRAP